MKFRANDQIIITFINNNYQIIVGPVINRSKLYGEYYQLIIDSNYESLFSRDICEKNFILFHDLSQSQSQGQDQVQDGVKSECGDMVQSLDYNPMIRFKTIYKTFRNLFEIDHVKMMTDKITPMSDQDLLDDLDFMNNEIIKCKIAMNIFYQKSDMIKYNAYRQLIYTDTHKMFQLQSPDEYNNYLDHISLLIKGSSIDDTKKEFNHMRDVSESIWNDHESNNTDDDSTDNLESDETSDDLDSDNLDSDDQGSDDEKITSDDQVSGDQGMDDEKNTSDDQVSGDQGLDEQNNT